jgi:hypothetical protein
MNKKIIISIFFIGILIAGSNYVSIGAAADQDLAEQYAPILYFVKGEQCYPVNVSYALENSFLYENGDPSPLSTAPTAALLSTYTTDNYYLDNQRGTVAVGDNSIENDYQSKMAALGYTVYANVDTANNVIQYWFFYAFNGGDLNRHEGDWEMIQVVLAGGQPSEVMFSQHYAGQKAQWRQVDKEGDHVKVYVAQGSHANYIKPYAGKLGLASDTVGADGKILRPTDYTIEILSTKEWISFGGRWGWVGADQSASAEASILGEAGPNGPKFREGGIMWQPLSWASDLQPANDIFFLLEWLVYNFVMLFILFTIVSLLLLIFFVYRRKKKHGLGPRIFSLLYIDGSNQKSIGNILCIVVIIMAVLALFFPWYTVTANVTVPPSEQTGTFNAVSVDGINGIQIRLPDRTGPVPLGTLALPFYLIIGISLVFLVLSTIGISQSKKLGKKYVLRGIRLLIPFILILIFILLVASIIPVLSPPNIEGYPGVSSAMHAISASPFSGQYTIPTTDVEGGSIQLTWGFGIGAYLLLFAGILLIIAGFMEITAHEEFFEEKSPTQINVEKKNKEKTE